MPLSLTVATRVSLLIRAPASLSHPHLKPKFGYVLPQAHQHMQKKKKKQLTVTTFNVMQRHAHAREHTPAPAAAAAAASVTDSSLNLRPDSSAEMVWFLFDMPMIGVKSATQDQEMTML